MYADVPEPLELRCVYDPHRRGVEADGVPEGIAYELAVIGRVHAGE
jgi:hypothetical protein